jgi:ferric-dicitrate binding protein FerR (iron transport regulator)
LAAHPEEARAFSLLDATLKQAAPDSAIDVEAALRKVKTRAVRRTPAWAIAIAGLAAAAAVVVLFPRSAGERNQPVVEAQYTTPQGARDTVTLSDGTQIVLGPSTSVAVNGHDVTLVGEAFFTMAARKSAPYSVRANGATIRDIGTAFGVRAYPSEPLRVVVSSGIVEVASADAKVVLDSGDVGIVIPGGTVARTANAVTADDVAWMQGRLVFRNASMSQLGEDLRRWYGVELRVTDTALQRRHFTGSFSGEPASRVGDVIALALGARAERRGDTIVIRPRR